MSRTEYTTSHVFYAQCAYSGYINCLPNVKTRKNQSNLNFRKNRAETSDRESIFVNLG